MVVSLNAEKAYELIRQGEVEVIDVRDIEEWSRGHLQGFRVVPLANLRSDPAQSLPSSPESGVLFVCAGGTRSQLAARLAAAHGVKKVYDLRGGLRDWMRAGLPLRDEDGPPSQLPPPLQTQTRAA